MSDKNMKVSKLEEELKGYSDRLVKIEVLMGEKFQSNEKTVKMILDNIVEIKTLLKEMEEWKRQTRDNTQEIMIICKRLDKIENKKIPRIEEDVESNKSTILKWITAASTAIGIIVFIINKIV